MITRPEFASIKWNVSYAADLAVQLRQFEQETGDTHYHRALGIAIIEMMQYHQVRKDIIDDVKAIMLEWRKARSVRLFNSKEKLMSAEQIAERRRKKLESDKMRVKHHREGRNLPLLTYMKLEDPASLSPKRLHEEALKYQHMYATKQSFCKHLRMMWSALGFKDEEVIQQNKDERNLKCPHWRKTKKDHNSDIIETQRRPVGDVQQDSPLYGQGIVDTSIHPVARSSGVMPPEIQTQMIDPVLQAAHRNISPSEMASSSAGYLSHSDVLGASLVEDSQQAAPVNLTESDDQHLVFYDDDQYWPSFSSSHQESSEDQDSFPDWENIFPERSY